MKFTFPPESKPLDGYTIKRAIHRGGFGEVYYALSDAGKEVALKLLQQNLEIELRGVMQCMNLKHPNLVTIFDVRQDSDGDHWIVMEYVHGKGLETVIDDVNGPMPIKDVESWLAGMVAGLSFLHDRGIVHRDLKPANVFLENDVVKIGDVGLAKFITQSKRSAQTESVGTVYYMAPEVAHGRYGHEVDLYSLGIVLYEMLTGRVPFDGESTAEILLKHLSDQPDLSPIPKRLRPVLANALEKDPLKRTPTAEQMLAEFRKAVAGVEIATTIPEESFRAAIPQAAPIPVTEFESPAQPDRHAGFFEWPAVKDTKWDKERKKLDRKSAQHARIEERKAARHARREERKAARHVRNLERKSPQKGAPAVAPTPVPVPSDTSRSAKVHTSQSDQITKGLKAGAIVLIVMAVVMPRSFVGLMHTLVKAAIYGGICYGIYRLFVALTGSAKPVPATPGRTPRQIPVKELNADDNSAALCKTVVPAKPVAKKVSHVVLDPELPRQISLRSRVTELTGSLAFAVLCTGALTAAVALFSPVVQTPPRIALFAVVSLLGSWAILLSSKWYEGTKTGSGHRRIASMLFGGLVGAAAFLVHQFLLVQFSQADYNLYPRGLVHTIGTVNLTHAMQPSLFGYVLFFAALFLLRHWWRHADSLRRKRVAIASVLLTTLTGLVLSLVLTFPMLWGVTWAAAMASIVQLAAAWMPHEERNRVAEGRHVR